MKTLPSRIRGRYKYTFRIKAHLSLADHSLPLPPKTRPEPFVTRFLWKKRPSRDRRSLREIEEKENAVKT